MKGDDENYYDEWIPRKKNNENASGKCSLLYVQQSKQDVEKDHVDDKHMDKTTTTEIMLLI